MTKGTGMRLLEVRIVEDTSTTLNRKNERLRLADDTVETATDFMWCGPNWVLLQAIWTNAISITRPSGDSFEGLFGAVQT